MFHDMFVYSWSGLLGYRYDIFHDLFVYLAKFRVMFILMYRYSRYSAMCFHDMFPGMFPDMFPGFPPYRESKCFHDMFICPLSNSYY